MLFKYKYDISIVMGYYNRKPQTINTLNYFENYKELLINYPLGYIMGHMLKHFKQILVPTMPLLDTL